jgi:hypothetical protein
MGISEISFWFASYWSQLMLDVHSAGQSSDGLSTSSMAKEGLDETSLP